MHELAVISVFYNRADTVFNSVQTLVHQTYKCDLIYLIDDGSSDETTKELMKFVHFDNVRVERTENIGFVNQMIRAINNCQQFNFIAVHGSGDYSHPNRLETQLNYLKQNANCGIVGCWRKTVDADGCEIRRFHPEKTIYQPSEFIFCNFDQKVFYTNHYNPFSHGEVMIRRSAYDEVGGYNKNYYYAQDKDLWLRINVKWSLSIIPEELYQDVSRSDGVRNDPEKQVMQLVLSHSCAYHAMKSLDSPMEIALLSQSIQRALLQRLDNELKWRNYEMHRAFYNMLSKRCSTSYNLNAMYHAIAQMSPLSFRLASKTSQILSIIFPKQSEN